MKAPATIVTRIRKRGGVVVKTLPAGEFTDLAGAPVARRTAERMISGGVLAPNGDGLLDGHDQTFRLKVPE